MDRIKKEILFVSLLAGISVGLFLYQWQNIKEEVGISHIFQIGDCIQRTNWDDEWEIPTIWKIIEVGNYSYRLGGVEIKECNNRHYCFSIKFYYQNYYTKVSCNSESN